MASDVQITGEQDPQARLREMQRQFETLEQAFGSDGNAAPDDQEVLDRVRQKLDQAEQILNGDVGSDPSVLPHTTEATIAEPDGPSEDGPLVPPIATSITAAVGKGGTNAPQDVQTVQQLLNQNGASLVVDGLVGPKTIGAITKFQQASLGFGDGRVDPGGMTWEALAQGRAAPPPEGFDDDLKSLIDDLPSDDAPPPTIENKERADDDDGPKGDWVGVETTIELGPLAFKVSTDNKGKVTGGGLELGLKADVPPVGVPPYYFGGGAALFGETTLQGPGPLVDVFFKVGGKGVGYLGVGPAVGGMVAGFKVEVELNGIFDAPFDAILNLETPSASEGFFGLPLQFSAGGAIKAGAEIKAGSFGISKMVPIREYKEFVFIRIENGPDCLISLGPGYDQFVTDIQNLHKQVIDAVEAASENPKLAGTGDTGPLLVDEANSVADDIHRVANEAQIAALRMAEQQMLAAYQAGWANPALVGKANALTQQDEARAREIYGQAWTQRALAKQSYDGYGSPLDNAPIEIIDARRDQASTIAAKFNAAVALFQQGDNQW
ncbi:MAG: peptidoglycan-binding protein [Pseudomonadota bacterium]